MGGEKFQFRYLRATSGSDRVKPLQVPRLLKAPIRLDTLEDFEELLA